MTARDDRSTAPGRVGTHLLGFALLGWAWPAFVVAGRILLWIVTAALIVALVVVDGLRWVRSRCR